jgi:hypothetical protein
LAKTGVAYSTLAGHGVGGPSYLREKKSFIKIENSSQHFSYPHLCDGNGNDADSSRLSATS